MGKLGVAFAAVTVLMVTWSGAAGAADREWKMTDQHVILFKGGIPADLAGRVVANGGRMVRQHQEIGVAIASGLSEEGAAAVAGNAGIARDLSLRLLPALDETNWSIEELGDARPLGHDPAGAALFPLQWNMRIIHADDAWAAGFESGSEIRVAILDSGIDPFHFDLAGLVDPLDSAAFVPALTGPPDWVDDNFHGTHVAGIVASNGIGTSGVAPHTTLVAVKVCDALGNCSFAAIIAGILHAATVGVDVINLSLGGTFPKNAPGGGPLLAALNRAVNYASRHGVLVVSGAGNDAVDLQHNRNLIVTPCESGAGLCVSASGPDDFLASYSNYGTSAIDVGAPGGDSLDTGNALDSMVLGPCTTRSVLPELAGCAANLQYILVEGTSQAAPHVAGAAALLDAQSNGALSAAKLKTALQRTADDLGKPGTDPHYGKGRLNVCSLLGC